MCAFNFVFRPDKIASIMFNCESKVLETDPFGASV